MAVNPSPEPGAPEPGAPEPGGRLACGRDAALVWDRAAAGETPDAHERDCPHCTATAADARGLDALVHRMAAEPLEPPQSVLDRVMVAVRTELRPHDVIVLPSPHGPARLSRAAAAAVLRHTVDGMGGLRARSCRIDQVADTLAGDPGQLHAVDVAITVTARFGVDLASVTARVRQMVAAAGEQALGVPVRRVDIEVVDLFGEDR
ncbi:Asp23/Gls24 family envelope stress response protein [Pseudonocardia sp.]|uniref:Asp23/Gls24 family envelope stress response protein n=1 Tax=Pseudonocardia sp. TaxID=60912 RepID=UPI00261DEE59|nr:Asp23/Gls24 family envelope stress response protein [Pseudonocardia sp.]